MHSAHQAALKQDKYKKLVEDAAKLHYRARQHRLYEVGNKVGKLLAWLARRGRMGGEN